jgi:DNA-binding NtrC family response regulator
MRRASYNSNMAVELQRETIGFEPPITNQCGFRSLVGLSPAMKAVYELIVQAAETNAGVLITGESGTGKELVALYDQAF